MNDKIDLNPWPSYSQEEADAASKVLLSNKVNYWTGSEGREFEKEFAEFADAEYAIAVSNGTTALDLALKALDIGVGDEVIVTSRTFIASVSSIITAGATPIFADVDRDSQNISPATIKAVISNRTKAIICVHLAGWPCDMDEIKALADDRGIYLIEDCAQAHGARYKGRSVGAIGSVGAWSFCQDKIMTTGGEGGMVTTNDHALWEKMWSYKDHGKSYNAVYYKHHPPGFRWLHESFGTNWRLTELQSAIGRIQLRRMREWQSARKFNAKALELVSDDYSCVRVPVVPEFMEHAYYKFYMFVVAENLAPGWDRNRILEELNQMGVPVRQGSCSEVYLEKAFEGTGLRPETRLPIARQLGETSLMFMVHPTISPDQMTWVCDQTRIVLAQASLN